MQIRKLPGLAAVLTIGLTAVHLTPARPARAQRGVPFVVGSYFGQLVSEAQNRDASDLNVNLQAGRRISGILNVAGRIQNLPFTGRISRSRLTASAKSRIGPNRVNLTMTANVFFGGANGLTVLDGTYRFTGAIRERGTFEFNGTSQPPPDPEFDPR